MQLHNQTRWNPNKKVEPAGTEILVRRWGLQHRAASQTFWHLPGTFDISKLLAWQRWRPLRCIQCTLKVAASPPSFCYASELWLQTLFLCGHLNCDSRIVDRGVEDSVNRSVHYQSILLPLHLRTKLLFWDCKWKWAHEFQSTKAQNHHPTPATSAPWLRWNRKTFVHFGVQICDSRTLEKLSIWANSVDCEIPKVSKKQASHSQPRETYT